VLQGVPGAIFEPLIVAAWGALPSGTVTFAFTDIEGSTARWERDPAAMQEAVRRHDAIVSRAIEQCGGDVFKTMGDAFFSAFARPEDAVAAMLAAQRVLIGPDHPDVAQSLNDLANLYRAQGRYVEAEWPHTRTLAIREKALGPDHPEVPESLDHLAAVYRDQGRHQEAEPLLSRALSIAEKALGPDHRSTKSAREALETLRTKK
jgi:tetratricopeptide (TPR) repeat protein